MTVRDIFYLPAPAEVEREREEDQMRGSLLGRAAAGWTDEDRAKEGR